MQHFVDIFLACIKYFSGIFVLIFQGLALIFSNYDTVDAITEQ